MKIYKVDTRNVQEVDGDDEHRGYRWTTSMQEAKRIYNECGADFLRGDEIKEIELRLNKVDLIRFLNEHCSHPDNG